MTSRAQRIFFALLFVGVLLFPKNGYAYVCLYTTDAGMEGCYDIGLDVTEEYCEDLPSSAGSVASSQISFDYSSCTEWRTAEVEAEAQPEAAPAPALPGAYQPTAFSLPSAQELSQFEAGTSVATVIGRLIQALLTIIGSVALGMFIYGGVLFMTSAGNAEKKKKALLIMVWTSLGVVVMLTSYIIVNFVFQAFG